MISMVGTGLSLPCDGEPYGPGDSEYAAGQRLLRRVIGSLGKRLAQYVVADSEFATAPFLHTAGDLGLRVVARLNEQLYRLRYLHRGKHRVHSSAQFLLLLWLSLSRPRAADSS
jgi:hypothetical protein